MATALSREFGIIFKAGASFLQEGFSTLLRFVRQIIEHRRIASQLLDASLPIQFGIQPCLYHAESQRAVLHHRFCPLHDFILQPFQRDNLVDHSHLIRLLCGILAAQEPYLTGTLLPHATGKIGRTEAGIETAHLRAPSVRTAHSPKRWSGRIPHARHGLLLSQSH